MRLDSRSAAVASRAGNTTYNHVETVGAFMHHRSYSIATCTVAALACRFVISRPHLSVCYLLRCKAMKRCTSYAVHSVCVVIVAGAGSGGWVDCVC